ncbi:MAG: cytidylate kinase family protein [Candidatus Pacebacteria bacterium]|nr:cytidylate kinase family protein [Candidatus Paceibacterota bacterium]
MAKITIFGLAGTGTSSVGRLLAKKIGADFISAGDIYRQTAKDLGLSLVEYEKICAVDGDHDRALEQKMKEYGESHEHFVAESRLAWFSMPDAFKIKFITDFDERLARVVKRDGVSLEAALAETSLREKAALDKYRTYYGLEDYSADEHFGLIIDTTHLTQDEVVQKICEYVGV